MQDLPKEGLVITRKRKKWKFAHFDSYQNCFSVDANTNLKITHNNIQSYFPRSEHRTNRKTVLEIAAGTAQFSVALAKLHPEYNFIAIDIKSDRLYTGAKQALKDNLKNIVFLRMSLTSIGEFFESGSIHTIWLTFPDPHPKKRSAKHRLTHEAFLQQYRKILEPTGEVKFKTDNRELFLWSLEQITANKWNIQELSFDLHNSNLSQEYKIMTHYEQRFTAQDIPINFLSIR